MREKLESQPEVGTICAQMSAVVLPGKLWRCITIRKVHMLNIVDRKGCEDSLERRWGNGSSLRAQTVDSAL